MTFRSYKWKPWFAWYPVRIQSYCCGLPTGNNIRWVWWKVIDRQWDIDWRFWRYKDVECFPTS